MGREKGEGEEEEEERRRQEDGRRGGGEQSRGEEKGGHGYLLLLELLFQPLKLLLALLHVLLHGLDLCLPAVHVRLDLPELFLQLFLLPRLPGSFILTMLNFLLELRGKAEREEMSPPGGRSPSVKTCLLSIWPVACFYSLCGTVMLGPKFTGSGMFCDGVSGPRHQMGHPDCRQQIHQ